MRSNNFDFLRIVLALLVLRWHANLVGWDWILKADLLTGTAAVECFFVISGFLIFKSWDRSKGLGDYTRKRARRILPAYVFVILACAILLASVSTLSASEYFSNSQVYRYIGAHLSFFGFLQSTLPGVFESNVVQYVNGPLWTIKIEVMFYAVVPIIAWLARRTGVVSLFTVIYLLSTVWRLGFEHLEVPTGQRLYEVLGRQLPGQMSFFVAGGAIFHFFELFQKHAHRLLALSVPILILHSYYALPWLYPAALAIAVLYVAVAAPYLGNFGRYGDFSYGLYIYHYPILQTIAAVGLFADSPPAAFALGATITVVVSVLSWHYLERPMLHKTSHYVEASQAESKPNPDVATEPQAKTSTPTD
ncbi:MAG: acyltransferase family protein [Rubripirellula sp.]